MSNKEMFIVICPRCKSTDVDMYLSIYDEIGCKCNECKYNDSVYSNGNDRELFIILCPKCNSSDTNVYYSIYDEIVCKCNVCSYNDSAYS